MEKPSRKKPSNDVKSWMPNKLKHAENAKWAELKKLS